MANPLAGQDPTIVQPAVDEPPRKTRISAAQWLDLFTRPSQFFSSGIPLGGSIYLVIASWLTGISSQIDRIDSQILQNDFGRQKSSWAFIESVINGHWAFFWTWILAGGAIFGAIVYLIGGWWYRMRLRLSGADPSVDATAARCVYMFAGIVSAVPTVLVAIVHTLLYPNYYAAYNSDEWISSFLIIFIFWSIAVSYVGATTTFALTRWKARVWFLILPSLVTVVILGGVVALFALFGEGF